MDYNYYFYIQLGDFDEEAEGFETFVDNICEDICSFGETIYDVSQCIEDKEIRGECCSVRDIPEETLKLMLDNVVNFGGYQLVLTNKETGKNQYLTFMVDGYIEAYDGDKEYTIEF